MRAVAFGVSNPMRHSSQLNDSPSPYRALAICSALVVTTLAVYWRAQYYPFLFFDDRDYLENFHVRSGASFANALWFFSHVHFSNWHPLTSIVYMFERQFFGLNPRPFHLVNILLHSANSVLVF